MRVLLITLLLVCARGAMAAPRAVSSTLEAFVIEMRTFLPQEGSAGYVVPTSSERLSFAAAIKAAAAGDVAGTEAALAPFADFELLDFEDTAGSGHYLAVVEKPPLHRGWGFVFVSRAPGRKELMVEVPHPLADRDSEVVGARAASAVKPRAFIMAGAHRYALPGRLSDVAHVSTSIFETAHETLAAEGTVVLQFHGFGLSLHPDYPDLVLSNSTTVPDARQLRLCTAASADGIDCRPFDGTAYTDLGAQTNVQAAALRRLLTQSAFLHFESGDRVRENPDRVTSLVKTLTTEWPAPQGCTAAPWSPLLWLLLLFTRRSSSRSSC